MLIFLILVFSFFSFCCFRYIFSLALADLLVIIICVPLASLLYTVESWPWGSALCRITECAKDISIGVSVFTLTALSAERYCAIVNPLRKLQVHNDGISFIRTTIDRMQNFYDWLLAPWLFVVVHLPSVPGANNI